MILSAISVIKPLPPVPMAPQSVQKMRDLAQTFGAAVRQRSVRQESWNSLIVPLSERNSAGWAGQPRTPWPREEVVMKNRPTRRAHVMLARFHLQNERRIFSSEECLASKKVFSSKAVNFSLFSLLWNYGIAVTFCFFLCFCWHCYSSLCYWPVFTNTVFRDRS